MKMKPLPTDADLILEIEKGAEKANVTMKELCRIAGVNVNVFWRLKKKQAIISKNYRKLLAALESL